MMDLWLAFGTVCHFGAVSDAQSDIRELVNGDVGRFFIGSLLPDKRPGCTHSG